MVKRVGFLLEDGSVASLLAVTIEMKDGVGVEAPGRGPGFTAKVSDIMKTAQQHY